MIYGTQSAPILQSKIDVNYAIMETIHPLSYHHNGFLVTNATLWQTYLICFMQVHDHELLQTCCKDVRDEIYI